MDECPRFRRRVVMTAAKLLLPLAKDAPLLIAVQCAAWSPAIQDLGYYLTLRRLAASWRRADPTLRGLDGCAISPGGGALQHELGRLTGWKTPGFRPQGSDAGDQRRIMTPEQAWKLGWYIGDWFARLLSRRNAAATLRRFNDLRWA